MPLQLSKFQLTEIYKRDEEIEADYELNGWEKISHNGK